MSRCPGARYSRGRWTYQRVEGMPEGMSHFCFPGLTTATLKLFSLHLSGLSTEMSFKVYTVDDF